MAAVSLPVIMRVRGGLVYDQRNFITPPEMGPCQSISAYPQLKFSQFSFLSSAFSLSSSATVSALNRISAGAKAVLHLFYQNQPPQHLGKSNFSLSLGEGSPLFLSVFLVFCTPLSLCILLQP